MEIFLYLSTIGHKTGNLHEIEIWFVEYGDCFYLCAGGRDKIHWVQNIRANPSITFHVDGKHYTGTGRIPSLDEDANLLLEVGKLFDAKYRWSNGLMVELCGSLDPAN